MRGGRSGGGGGRSEGGYRNPCLTMHQPWASLLVHGIKRVEGRSWPSPVTGRLWIHAASKVPDPDTVATMEAFYREIHAVDGVTTIDFPKHYPVSRLLGQLFLLLPIVFLCQIASACSQICHNPLQHTHAKSTLFPAPRREKSR